MATVAILKIPKVVSTSTVWYGGHFESKMTAKIQKSSDLGEIWFPSRL
jgi:hypothetical protein